MSSVPMAPVPNMHQSNQYAHWEMIPTVGEGGGPEIRFKPVPHLNGPGMTTANPQASTPANMSSVRLQHPHPSDPRGRNFHHGSYPGQAMVECEPPMRPQQLNQAPPMQGPNAMPHPADRERVANYNPQDYHAQIDRERFLALQREQMNQMVASQRQGFVPINQLPAQVQIPSGPQQTQTRPTMIPVSQGPPVPVGVESNKRKRPGRKPGPKPGPKPAPARKRAKRSVGFKDPVVEQPKQDNSAEVIVIEDDQSSSEGSCSPSPAIKSASLPSLPSDPPEPQAIDKAKEAHEEAQASPSCQEAKTDVPPGSVEPQTEPASEPQLPENTPDAQEAPTDDEVQTLSDSSELPRLRMNYERLMDSYIETQQTAETLSGAISDIRLQISHAQYRVNDLLVAPGVSKEVYKGLSETWEILLNATRCWVEQDTVAG